MLWSVGTGAAFVDGQNTTATLIIDSISSGTVVLQTNALWNGDPITVTTTIVDNGPAGVKDANLVITWTLVGRGLAPTSMKWVDFDPQNQWISVGAGTAQYAYEVLKDVNVPGQPNFEKQTVLEIFDSYSSGGFFSLNDLKPEYANLQANVDELAKLIFPPTGNEGTFVVDNLNRIYDQHSGFFGQEAFTPAALARGIGFQFQQHYKAAGKTLGTYTVEQTLKVNANGFEIKVRKNGP